MLDFHFKLYFCRALWHNVNGRRSLKVTKSFSKFFTKVLQYISSIICYKPWFSLLCTCSKHWSKYRGRFFQNAVITLELDIKVTSTLIYLRYIVKQIYRTKKEKDIVSITHEFKVSFRGYMRAAAVRPSRCRKFLDMLLKMV